MTTTAPVLMQDRSNPYGSVGVKLAGVTDADEALKLGGLDWTVTLEDVQSPVLGDHGVTTVAFPDKRATIRNNPDGSKAPLGIVGTIYNPLQNSWTGELLQQVVDSSGATFGAVGSTHNGNRTFVQMLLPDGVLIGGHDQIDMSIIVFNSHDGSSLLTGIPTAIRPACCNQFPAIKRSATRFSIRHTARGTEVNMDEIRRSIDLTFAYAKEVEQIGGILVSKPMSDSEFAAFVDKYSPVVKHPKTKLELVSSITRRQALTGIFREAENLENVRGTQWAALQAVIEYEDWFRPVKKGSEREARIVAHTGDTRKRKAQDLLLAR